MISDANLALVQGDAQDVLATFAPEVFRTCVTSPPYWGQRNYEGAEGQLGHEKTPAEYVARLVQILEGVKRVLTRDGTLWLNLGDSYAGGGNGDRDPERWKKQAGPRPIHAKRNTGLPNKNLLMVPARVAIALQDAGWILRQDIIWQKKNPLPAPVTDRCVSSHEYVFLLSKGPTYYFDYKAIQEPSVGKNVKLAPSRGPGKNETRDDPNANMVIGFNKRWREKSYASNVNPQLVEGLNSRDRTSYSELRNKRDVWTIAVARYKGAHTAVMPEELVDPCVLAGSAVDDVVLDPFCGTGTVGVVALRHKRNFVGIDLSAQYLEQARTRITASQETAA